MSRIRPVPPAEAEGPLAAQYDAATRRAGRIWHIVSIMSPNPAVLEASMGFYRAVMHGPSPLSRVEREMLAVVVSATNGCRY